MPRKSAAALSIIQGTRETPMLSPPQGLSAGQKAIFTGIIAAKSSGFFESADIPLIVALSRHLERSNTIEQRLEGIDPAEPEFENLSKSAERESRMTLALMRALRLTPQSRYRPDSEAAYASAGRGDALTILMEMD